MIRAASFLAFGLLLLTTGCTSTGGYPGYPPSGPGYRPGHGHATHLPGPAPTRYFDLGYNRGRADARRGYSHNPGRHYAEVPTPARGEFSTGYNRGYRQTGKANSRPQPGYQPGYQPRPSYGYPTHY